MVMNYNLPNSQQQSLATNVGGETVKAMALGSSQAMLALANKKGVANRNNQVGFQKATCTRVPCHARGMSTDHNALVSYWHREWNFLNRKQINSLLPLSQTAFLEIPNDAVHGLHLLCSHPTCRGVGVKFRYCYFCKKPVTKQNFRSRHLHADLAEKEKNKKSAAQPMMPPLPPNSTETMCFPTSAPPSPPLALQQPSNPTLFVGNSEVNISPRSNLQSLIDAANANQKRPREESTMSSQQRLWAALLRERPSNVMSIPAWLSKVISTSAHTNTRPPSPLPLSTSSLDKESRWNKLLMERPDGTEDEGQLNAWLVQVLEVSAPTRCKSPASIESYEGLSQRFNSPSSLSEGNLQPFLPSAVAEPVSKKRKF